MSDHRIRADGESGTRLDRANAGFEQFISTVAHNLRESLRDIAAYNQLISESYAGRLDADADLYLARIQDGAARAQSLLSDVVDYWSIGAAERHPASTDMEAALAQALLCAERQVVERNAVVTHAPLPAAIGEFELLTKVLHHLIRNAIEYCVATPRIHISFSRVDLAWIFSIEDNGPGIEAAFQGRIFEPFRRLHGREYPGNGLGLAFCKKAIEWQGGRIWMESTPGAGSTFHFTLAASD